MLWTDRDDYRDFHLRVEARVPVGSDSGVLFRAAPQKGYEAEINPGSLVPTGSLWERSGDFAVLATAPEASTPKAGEWFTLEVIAQGSRLQVLVNGRTTADVTDATSAQGPFALQCRGKGGSVEFRKIEIKELRPSDGFVPLFNGRDTTGWTASPKSPGKWRVQNSVLVGSDGPGFLFSDSRYRDFHLKVEAMLAAPGNGGINFRDTLRPRSTPTRRCRPARWWRWTA
jgi:hypothetical protein